MPATLTLCYNCGAETDDSVHADGDDYCQKCFSELFTECANCGEIVSQTDATSADGIDYCAACFSELFTLCDHCHYVVAYEDTRSEGDSTYCQDCFNDLFDTCNHCQCVYPQDALIPVAGSNYCSDCFSDLFVECTDCGGIVDRDDCTYNDDGEAFCDNCGGRTTWNEGAPMQGVRVARTRSLRRYGVELETHACENHENIRGRTSFGCKEDGSIHGMEFVSPVLQGDEGLEEIELFCRLARNFTVNQSCGYHVHFDMERNATATKHVALAYSLTAQLWGSFVPRSRRENRYCEPIEWSWHDMKHYKTWDSLRRWAGMYTRYCWVNIPAIRSHGTIEIRLHTGTLDSTKINNWIISHLRFIEWAVNSSYQTIRNTLLDGHQWDALVKIIDNAEVTDYLAERARKWSGSSESDSQ